MNQWKFIREWRELPKEQRLETWLIICVFVLATTISIITAWEERKIAKKDIEISDIRAEQAADKKRYDAQMINCYQEGSRKIERLTDKVLTLNAKINELEQQKE